MSTRLDETFDVEHEEGSKFDLLPPARYNADLMRTEVITFKSGKGQGVKFFWCVWDGEYEGRWLFDTVVISHESAEAQRIGRRKFKDICVACGVLSPISDVSVLVEKRCTLVVGVDKSEEYGDQNRVKRVLPFTAPTASAAPASTAPAGNGKVGDILHEASTVPPSGKPEDAPFDDDVPY